MDHKHEQGEALNALIDAAYRGRIGRRTFFKALLAAGMGVVAARELAEHAALAQANQAARLADMKAEYDYIVVGAGSAGCVMANRLSQDGRASVLVIEAGGADLAQAKIANPLLWITNIGSDTDWGIQSVPQAHLDNRVTPVPVGKIIGGGSSINAVIWMRGDKSDYDAWEAAAGPNWNFASILRNFKKVERYAEGEGPYRGGAGMIPTHKPAPTHPALRAFIDSAKEIGLEEKFDLNGAASPLGAGQLDVNTENGRRVTAAHAYLNPALSRSNLTLLTSAQVTRLELGGGQCRGVMVMSQGQERRIGAAKEVILSAGAVYSPKLLMVSGVGPADHLRSLGIGVAADSPAVGSNLHDHLLLRIVFTAKQPIAREELGISGTAYLKTRASRPGPDIQIFGRHDAFGLKDVKPDGGYALLTGMMKPVSRGTLRLTSADPLAPPVVNPNYLAEPSDLDVFVQGVEAAIAIGNGKGYSGLRNDQYHLKGASKAEIGAYIRANAGTYYHYSGTCSMGKDARAPVDEALRVRGIGRLRVVDASVIPQAPCCNTNPAVLSLAERAAELMLAGG